LASIAELQHKDRDFVEFIAYVRIEGKMTIPKEVRDSMDIRTGDLVRCRIVKVKVR